MSGIPVTGGMRQAVIKIGRNPEGEFSLLSADGFRDNWERKSPGYFEMYLSRFVNPDRAIISATAECATTKFCVLSCAINDIGDQVRVYIGNLDNTPPTTNDDNVQEFSVTVSQAL